MPSKVFVGFCLVLLLSVGASAQNTQVSGANVGNGTYVAPQLALAAINAGDQTNAVIQVQILEDTLSLSSSIVINQGNWTSLTITPVGARRIAGIFGGPIIDLNGADRVTIDGILTGGNSLILEQGSTGASSSTIRFINDATSNLVQGVTLLGAMNTVTTGTVLFSTASAGGNDNNVINGVSFGGSGTFLPAIAVYSDGSAGNANSGNTVINCDIADFFSANLASRGIFLNNNNDAWTIRSNRFFQTATRTYTSTNTHSAINIRSGSGHLIRDNRIGYALFNASGTYTMTGAIATRFIGIDLAVGTGATTSVQENLIGGFSLTTTSGASTGNGVWCGINISSGNVDVGTAIGNMIGEEFRSDSVSVTTSTISGLLVGINVGSAGNVRIHNNAIGSMVVTGATAGVGTNLVGIQSSGVAASLSITDNRIGYLAPDDMRSGDSATTTGSSLVTGINLASVPLTNTVSGNMIQNLSSYGTGSNGSVRGISTFSSTTLAGAPNIRSNTISSLKTNSTLAGVLNGTSSAIGISLTGGTNSVVTQNVISGISNTNTGTSQHSVLGIGHGNATGSTISANRVFDLSNAGTSTSLTAPNIVAGVLVRSGQGTITVVNNMVAVGSGVATDSAVGGIFLNFGQTPNPTLVNVYHNSINIEGVLATGVQSTFGIARTDFTVFARTIPVNLRGNLVVNSRTGGTGGHYAVGNNFGAAASSATGWTSDNNVFNANPASVGYWSGALTFGGWTAASAGDAASHSNLPVIFVDPASDLHLNMGTSPTILESNVLPISGVTTDIDGEVRPGPAGSVNGGGFVPDFGADEFDGASIDRTAPVINVDGIVIDCIANNGTVTATIVDSTGVPTSGSLAPRLYFRKNTDAYVSVAGTLSSGTAQSGTWTFALSSAAAGGVVIGDTLSYFVVAQDATPSARISANPSTGFAATDVNNVVSPPTNPLSFVVSPALGGTYTIGSAGDFPTLTAAVAVYNSACLSGPVLFSLIDATYTNETAPITINANTFASNINRLTIKPAPGVTPVIAVDGLASLLNLNGADFVTIDGSNGSTPNSLTPLTAATRDLTIQPASTTPGAVIWLSTSATGNAATNIVVQNVNVVGNNASYGIGVGGQAIGSNGTRNDNISFINNSVSSVLRGIVAYGASRTNKSRNINISQNTLTSGIAFSGISSVYNENLVISGNEVGNIATTVAPRSATGIIVGFQGETVSLTSVGVTDGASNVVISRNRVYNIFHSTTYSAAGIALGNTVSGTSLIANNMVSDVLSNGTGGDFSAGILLGGGTAPVNVVHNTVSISGTMPGFGLGSQVASALAVTSGSEPVMTISNNILSNTAVGPDGTTAIFSAVSYQFGVPTSTFASDRNDLFVSGTGTGTYTLARTGPFTGGLVYPTLAGWRTASGRDANSVSVAPVFEGPADLHLVAASNPQLLGAGQLFTGIDADFDNDLRDSLPDIGADEIVAGRSGIIPAGIYRDANLGTGTLAGNVRVTGVLNLSGFMSTGANEVQLDCGATVAGAGPSAYLVGNVEKSFCAASSFEFPVGTVADGSLMGSPPEYTPLTANVTAGTFPSSLTVSVTDGALPGSNALSSASRYWNITETGDITADLTFTYLQQDAAGDESTYQVLRRAASTTIYPGGSVNAALNQGFAPGVSEFSSWGAGNIIPTAAGGTIAGRAVTSEGNGIRNAVVTISGGQLAQPISVKTGSFGYYSFGDLPVGQNYVVTIVSKRFHFAEPSRIVNLTDSVLDADFIAEGR